jgi:hypothetical protein
MMFPEIIAVCPEIMQNTLSRLHGKNVQFLGALSLIVAKVPISSIVSVCLSLSPSVSPRVQLDFHRADFHEILYWRLLLQFVDKPKYVKIGEKLGILHEDMRSV